MSADDLAAPYYTVNEFNRLAGSCYLFLDRPERAEPILRTTTRALASKKKSQAIALGNLALALIRQEKLDEAAGVIHRTIDAVELTRGGGGLNVAFAAGRELRPWRNEPWAQDINDRLVALMAVIWNGWHVTDLDQAKQAVRERAWRRLMDGGGAPPDSYGKIPGFHGAEETAVRLAGQPEWQQATTVKANPDWAQLPVRRRALEDGKLLYMAVPRMAALEPFYVLDPTTLTVPAAEAAEKRRAAQVARRLSVEAMRPVDVVVCGSVAVNRSGARIGKGAGYSDLEVALLVEAGVVTDATVIVTPVHGLQVIEEDIPETEHDFSVDIIVTPDEVIHCTDRRRPRGLIWNDLTAEKVAAIPVLAARAAHRSGA
jgi:5-formyltetrahydrofolate cyclo-ligase